MRILHRSRAHGTAAAELSVLTTEFRALQDEDKNRNPSVAKRIEELLAAFDSANEKRTAVAPEVLGELSFLLLALLPSTRLVFRIRQIRKQIHDLAAGSSLEPANSARVDTITAADEPEIRNLAFELQRVRAAASIAFMRGELFRSRVVQESLLASLLMMALCALAAVVLAGVCQTELTLFPIAAMFGALGAWISVAARIRDTDRTALSQHADLDDTPTSTVWISPVFGALGAILMTGAMKAKLIIAPFVPKPEAIVGACTADYWESAYVVKTFAALTEPSMLLFTFIVAFFSIAAGWSERFVPDLLEWAGKTAKRAGDE